MTPTYNQDKSEPVSSEEPRSLRLLSRDPSRYKSAHDYMREEQELYQADPLSENETEIDVDEAEDVMNNVPSPRHRAYCCWNPEYEARRQAPAPSSKGTIRGPQIKPEGTPSSSDHSFDESPKSRFVT
ncbi:MAG: hypothetical protein Q9170_002270 [Blastenia crenularia]